MRGLCHVYDAQLLIRLSDLPFLVGCGQELDFLGLSVKCVCTFVTRTRLEVSVMDVCPSVEFGEIL